MSQWEANMWHEKYSATWPILDQTVGERKRGGKKKKKRKAKERVLER